VFQPVLGVDEPVNAQVAALAGGYDVRRGQTDGLAVAQVGHGEDDLAVGVVCRAVVELNAAAQYLGALVDATLPGTLAAALGADVANEDAELCPAGGVVGMWHGHYGSSAQRMERWQAAHCS
jgi:hypothetical protein